MLELKNLHCNSRFWIILCLEIIAVSYVHIADYFWKRCMEDYFARTRKYDTCWKKFNVTTSWNKEHPIPCANKVGIPFQSFVLCKGYFSGMLRREVVSGTVTLGIPADYPIIKSSVCCYLNKHSCCFPRNMASSSKEKKGQLVLLKWRGTQNGIYVFMRVFVSE